jgi:hypothetical protein
MAYPTESSSRRSVETRAATEMADILRGWVMMIDAVAPRFARIRESRINCGTLAGTCQRGKGDDGESNRHCVVFPHPIFTINLAIWS